MSDLLTLARQTRPFIEKAAQSLPHELVGMYFEEVAG